MKPDDFHNDGREPIVHRLVTIMDRELEASPTPLTGIVIVLVAIIALTIGVPTSIAAYWWSPGAQSVAEIEQLEEQVDQLQTTLATVQTQLAKHQAVLYGQDQPTETAHGASGSQQQLAVVDVAPYYPPAD